MYKVPKNENLSIKIALRASSMLFMIDSSIFLWNYFEQGPNDTILHVYLEVKEKIDLFGY